MNTPGQPSRVLSGMRPTGPLHLGHYHGVIKPWVEMQHVYDCYYFVADWHALTTNFDDVSEHAMRDNVLDMVVDWLASGVDPELATIFIQSKVPEHAELYLLLSMISPLGWLERVPSFKDQQEKLKNKDLSTHGFLGYPVLQSADILMYRASLVPVGQDQIPHVELTRELARRFNSIFGKEEGFEDKAEKAIAKLGKRNAAKYRRLRIAYTERGDPEALQSAKEFLTSMPNLSRGDRERLTGYLEGSGRQILVEPDHYVTEASKVPGTDGQKMSKSYGNAIFLRDDPDRITKLIRSMPTDPARIRRNDPGDPEKCPVWDLHKIYSDEAQKKWVCHGCTTAEIGCLDCKEPLIGHVLDEQAQHIERARPYIEDKTYLTKVIADGCERAGAVAEETMKDVRHYVGTGSSR
ncbi:MAG: tryptophan--tRNA ligase [Gammaproteobacteria bacterium]|nr:tryptophan--tRNA ligase [Gammaproteobacteria bacterium]